MLETKILILFSPFLLVAEAQNDMLGSWFYPGAMGPSPWFGYESTLKGTLYGYECQQPNGYFPICGDYLTNCDCYVECENSIATTYRCPKDLYYSLNTQRSDLPCNWLQAQSNGCGQQPVQQYTPSSDTSQIIESPTQSPLTETPATTSSPSTNLNLALIQDLLKSAVSDIIRISTQSSDISTSSQTTVPPTQSPSTETPATTQSPSTNPNLSLIEDLLKSAVSDIIRISTPSSDISTSSQTTVPPTQAPSTETPATTQSPSTNPNLELVKDLLNSVFHYILGNSTF